MNQYPLVFRFRDWIPGSRFVAGVQLVGRVLMSKEEDDGQWWIYGVTPGGLSESGDDPSDAYAKFRAFFKGILTDFAEEAATFEEFEAKVQRFVGQTDNADAKVWDDTRAAVKAGGQVDPALGGMPKLSGDIPAGLLECVRLTPAPAIPVSHIAHTVTTTIPATMASDEFGADFLALAPAA